MKKIVMALVVSLSVVGFFAFRAMAFNFNGNQTLNGLNGASTLSMGVTSTLVFAAPVTGVYFVNGQLTLPQLSPGAPNPSQVVSTVLVGTAPTCTSPTVVYTGLPGANGFQVNQISVNGGSTVCVQLTSSAAVDSVLNAVRGTVAFGNTF